MWSTGQACLNAFPWCLCRHKSRSKAHEMRRGGTLQSAPRRFWKFVRIKRISVLCVKEQCQRAWESGIEPCSVWEKDRQPGGVEGGGGRGGPCMEGGGLRDWEEGWAGHTGYFQNSGARQISQRSIKRLIYECKSLDFEVVSNIVLISPLSVFHVARTDYEVLFTVYIYNTLHSTLYNDN